jgi:hypothetical protein
MTQHDDPDVITGDATPQPGRPVVLVPTPPGFWMLLLGVSVAALAPLFGFLVGGVIGPGDGDESFSPIYLWLLIGVFVGGLGVLLAILGGVRLYRFNRHNRVAQEAEDVRAGREIGGH